MGPGIATIPAGLRALGEDIATAEHHITAMPWDTKSFVAIVLPTSQPDTDRSLTPFAIDSDAELPQLRPTEYRSL